jgi:hypothetical protein
MNIELLKQLADLRNQFNELKKQYRESGATSIRIDGEVHVRVKDLIGKENLVIESRGSREEYPFELSYSIEGIKVFAIVRLDELANFPQFKEYRKSLLLKQLAELENEEEVTA